MKNYSKLALWAGLLVACSGSNNPYSNPKRGAVNATSDQFTIEKTVYKSSSLSAFFVDDGVFPDGCTYEAQGDCEVVVCRKLKYDFSGVDLSVVEPPDLTGFTYPNAGEILVSAEKTASATIKPIENDGRYESYSKTDAILWKGGEKLTFDAIGERLPLFHDESLHAPTSVDILTPSFPELPKRLKVNPARNLIVEWDRGMSGDRVVVSVASGDVDATGSVTCRFPAADNRGTVPTELLTKLPQSQKASFSITVQQRKEMDLAGYYLLLGATTSAKLPEGNAAIASVILAPVDETDAGVDASVVINNPVDFSFPPGTDLSGVDFTVEPVPDMTIFQSCGNFMVEGTETCDDGNTNDNDGCSSKCKTEINCGGHGSNAMGRDPNTGHCYLYFDQSRVQGVGFSDCKNYGGHMVTITSKQEYDVVRALLIRDNDNERRAWIGLYDEFDDQDFAWVTSEAFINAKVQPDKWGWALNEPNNADGNERCAIIRSAGWDDQACDKKYELICEYE